ncbi:MAG: AAA family ATPase [Proteobacteria bacterium]|nr:AAA family ATPase [Pseudomonadota bacterium]
MIKKIRCIKNIGQFDNIAPDEDTELTPFSLCHADNGRGKTTLTAILRSLAVGKPEFIKERHRLGATHPPEVVLSYFDEVSHSDKEFVFQNGGWSATLDNIAIFDDVFVADNVCSGIDVSSETQQNQHELILGQEGAKLYGALQHHIEITKNHTRKITELGKAIPEVMRGPYGVDAFCNLTPDENIDAKIAEAERGLKAAQSVQEIQQRAGFSELKLPDFEIDAISKILGTELGDISSDVENRIQGHIKKLGESGTKWVADGMQRVASVSDGLDKEACPFCAQDLEGSDLFTHYRAYFSEEYINLKTTIEEMGVKINKSHSGDELATFERNASGAMQTGHFWQDFCEIPPTDIDTKAIARDWVSVRDAILEALRKKYRSPLEGMSLSEDTMEAVRRYQQRVGEVAKLSNQLAEANKIIASTKKDAGSGNPSLLENELNKLHAHKRRFTPEVMPRCDAYMEEKNAKLSAESHREQARDDLKAYQENIFSTYSNMVNDYLDKFGASFQIEKMRSSGHSAGASSDYQIVIKQKSVKLKSNDFSPSFKNTLSAGDRNALALAFFFASLERDAGLEEKIVVLDDPITSLDKHRRQRTCEEIKKLASRVKQVIILSHFEPFLFELWHMLGENERSAIRINRTRNGSEIIFWDVHKDNIPEHDKNYELVDTYLQAADSEKAHEVAKALRPMLEAFIRVAFPKHFPPGKQLGHFLNTCRDAINEGDEILSSEDLEALKSLNNYAKKFHHSDTNREIDDAELSEFAKRTLRFISRR